MDYLSKLLVVIFGQAAAAYLGGAFILIVYGGLFALILIPLFWIQQRYFPKLSENQAVRMVALIVGGVAFWLLIPWLFWSIFFKVTK
jgi:hypothetical protein